MTSRGHAAERWARRAAAVVTGAAVAVGLLCPASAAPVTAARLKRDSAERGTYLVDGHYLRDEAAIAAMRAKGELPDTIGAGRCRFDLAGDPGVVYYVRSCRRRATSR